MTKESEYINISIRKDLYDLIKELDFKRKTQNNYYTAYPIYLIQSRYWVSAIEDEADEEFLIYCDESSDMTLEDIHNGKLEEILREDELNISESIYESLKLTENMKEVVDILVEEYEKGNYYSYWEPYSWCVKKEWITKAYFLTEEDALNYMKYQSHNLGKCRLYVDYIGYDNRGKLSQILKIFDTNNTILKED